MGGGTLNALAPFVAFHVEVTLPSRTCAPSGPQTAIKEVWLHTYSGVGMASPEFWVGRDPSRTTVLSYLTDTVTLLWLILPPIDTVTGRSPDGAFDGICTLSCIIPATKPGASPAYT